MPTWGEILKEFQQSAQGRQPPTPDSDGIRGKYIAQLRALTPGRAVITYMSGWLEGKQDSIAISVNGSDVHGLMEVCYGVAEEELDLVIHSPGGSPTAAEQMLEYLRTQFKYIRAIIPLQAKSAATMIALGCDEIVMGHHSELGPVDPQILISVPDGRRFAPAHAILRDFERAKQDCKADVGNLPAWTPSLRSYAGGLIEFCHQQVALSMDVIEKWLVKYMLAHPDMNVAEADRQAKAHELAQWFGSEKQYDFFRAHARPIRYEQLKAQGLRVRLLEDDPKLQDAALSIYHREQVKRKRIILFAWNIKELRESVPSGRYSLDRAGKLWFFSSVWLIAPRSPILMKLIPPSPNTSAHAIAFP